MPVKTMIWLDFALKCGYLSSTVHSELVSEYEQIGKIVGAMVSTPENSATMSENDLSGTAHNCSLQIDVSAANCRGAAHIVLSLAADCQLPTAN